MKRWTGPVTVTWAVLITTPVVAGLTVAIGERVRRSRRGLRLVADYGIHNVPERPPLWRAAPQARPVTPITGVSPVPPENPHAPPTPPSGIGVVGHPR
jgi:hypothetical protein